MKIKKKSMGVLSIIAVLLLTLQMITFAEGGNGGGSGSGSGNGGGDNPLTLESVDTESDINALRVDEVIYLNFSNNVVNLSVKENNMTCFAMTYDDGSPADFVAFFGDDQVDRDIRNTIEIRPADTWQAGATYHLTIKKDLTSKNGSSLGKDKEIVFTIADAEEGVSAEETNVETPTSEEVTSEEVTSDEAADTADTNVEAGEDADADTKDAETVNEAVENGNINYGLLIGAIIIIAGGYWFVKRKK